MLGFGSPGEVVTGDDNARDDLRVPRIASAKIIAGSSITAKITGNK